MLKKEGIYMREEHLPVSEKFCLTIREASDYFGIGIKKMWRLAELNPEDFAVFNGSRLIIIRTRFEEYLLNCSYEKEGLGRAVKKPVLGDKDLLTADETARFYGLSRRKLTQFLKPDKDYQFIVYYRKRKLIIRDEFDTYMEKYPDILEDLKSARPAESETP